MAAGEGAVDGVQERGRWEHVGARGGAGEAKVGEDSLQQLVREVSDEVLAGAAAAGMGGGRQGCGGRRREGRAAE